MSRSPEHHQPPELKPTLLHAYQATFFQRIDCFAQQTTQGGYISIKQPLTPKHIKAHLYGKITLGAYALDANSQATWICLDADDDDTWHQTLTMTAELLKQDIPAYIEPSRRGGHLWLFTPKIDAFTARQFVFQLLAQHNISKIEVYPKQDQLTTGPGSLVRLPLGVHRKSGRRYHFIQLNGQPLAPSIRDQVALLANPERIPRAFINQTIENISKPEVSKPVQLPKLSSAEGHVLSERIKSAISVYDFVSQFVELDARGVGFCPFHEDKHKSFGVNQERNFWNCWAGCGGGSVIDFYSKWRETQGQDGSFMATITDLAQKLFD